MGRAHWGVRQMNLTKHYACSMNHLPNKFTSLLETLPLHLAERSWLKANGRPGHDGQFVLYWTHHALRVDENPALDVAMLLAEQLGLPLLVYQGLSEQYRFASDRHHTFILEGVRELESNYAKLGISYAFHLERAADRRPRLVNFVKASALVVTEDFPLEATREWTERLAQANIAPMVLVDTACVVPSRLVGRAYDRAFAFRDATAKLYRERVDREWPACMARPIPAKLPFESLKLSDENIANLVSQCEIDHTIGPVADTRGGSHAGYARWQAFRKKGLRSYPKLRNQIEVDGVSRMSAYLHYGMVSPFRIAREASADGAEKYLDELLIWRELAYSFCYYRKDLETDASIPSWAIDTLKKHSQDTRHCLSWETLARAKSGSRLWDAAQRSLIKHGELHNNVRMTWGKAILEWSNDYKESLARLIDLNHRYALDGRDPASYGGILWCLGQFDRPFFPEEPVFGSVRTRPVTIHESRTNLAAYEKRVDRDVAKPLPRIAMIGSGLAGLMCSRVLLDHGISIKCFDKSHRVGGRSTTRIVEGSLPFDHGAQYFTIRDPILKPWLESWCQDSHIALWPGRIVSIDRPGSFRDVAPMDRYVGTPNMESLGKHLASDLSVLLDTEVATVVRQPDGYRLTSRTGMPLGEFDIVLWNCPPAQVEKLVPSNCDWRPELAKVEMVPCWAVMVAIENRWEVHFDGAFINDGKLGWMARNSSKPGRPNSMDAWVLHSNVAWAKNHLELSQEDANQVLTEEAERVTGVAMPPIRIAKSHRWLYSRPTESLADRSLWDESNRLGACGDWCGGPRVEGSLRSGMALAGRVLGSLHERTRLIMASEVNTSAAIQLDLFT